LGNGTGNNSAPRAPIIRQIAAEAQTPPQRAAQQVWIIDPNSLEILALENMPLEVRQKLFDRLWEDFKARTARSSNGAQ
jgi:hypothetical protein